MTERMQGGIHVHELDTSVGSMFEVQCAIHGLIPATFLEDEACDWASIHADRMHGTKILDVEVHYLNRRRKEAEAE